jgi:uroporphyrinogen-III decarboxylase
MESTSSLQKKVKYSHVIIAKTLLQACTTYSLQAAYGPLGLTVQLQTFGNKIYFKKCNCLKATFFSD